MTLGLRFKAESNSRRLTTIEPKVSSLLEKDILTEKLKEALANNTQSILTQRERRIGYAIGLFAIVASIAEILQLLVVLSKP